MYLFLQVRLEPRVLLGAVDKKPGEALAQQRREHRDAHNQEGVRPHDGEVEGGNWILGNWSFRFFCIYSYVVCVV